MNLPAFCYVLINNSAHRQDCLICSIRADLDTALRIRRAVGCVNNLSSAHIDRYMTGIADDIARLCVRIGYGTSR